MTETASLARQTNDLDAFWLPFTPNRAFKRAPRLISRAKDMHYFTPDGHAVLDGLAGLWCSNAGHNRDPIVAAIARQAAELTTRRPSISPIRNRSSSRAGSRRWRRPTQSGVLLQFRLGGGRHRTQDRARVSQRARGGRPNRRSAASAAIMASASAAFRSAALSTTANSLARCWREWIICRRPIAANISLHRRRAGLGRTSCRRP